MIRIEENFSRESEQLSLREDDSPPQLIELQAENTRLRQIVTELMIRNQQLREQVRLGKADSGSTKP